MRAGSGLWTPKGKGEIGKEGEKDGEGQDMVLDFSNSPPDSRPGTSGGEVVVGGLGVFERSKEGVLDGVVGKEQSNGAKAEDEPGALQRGLSQKGLWGREGVNGEEMGPKRTWESKRRWTVRGE